MEGDRYGEDPVFDRFRRRYPQVPAGRAGNQGHALPHRHGGAGTAGWGGFHPAGYTDLIYTSINSEGSATYQNAVQARGEFFEDHPEARDAFSIRVIDSHTYTMCYGYPVAEGARMAAAGASVE